MTNFFDKTFTQVSVFLAECFPRGRFLRIFSYVKMQPPTMKHNHIPGDDELNKHEYTLRMFPHKFLLFLLNGF